MLTDGHVLRNNTVVKYLGNGNFAYVYEAQNPAHASSIALKVSTSLVPEDQNRFKLENRILHHLTTHENVILPLSEIEEEAPYIYYVMELAKCNLDEYLKQVTSLNTEGKLQLFKEICSGLQHAHANEVIHRDLWWNNVLLKERENGEHVVKLTDFGRAKAFTLESIEYDGGPSWGIMVVRPPEVLFGVWSEATLSNYVRGDIYALGILLHFIMGSSPATYYAELAPSVASFKGANPIQPEMSESEKLAIYQRWLDENKDRRFTSLEVLVPDLPGKTDTSAKINAIIKKASHIDYIKRYSNIGDLIRDVESL